MGFFDNIDEEADADFLARVQSTQTQLQNVQEGEAVVPILSQQGLLDRQAFNKEPVEDYEVDFFKDFAMEDLDDLSQKPISHQNTQSTSACLPSIDVELDEVDTPEITSKQTNKNDRNPDDSNRKETQNDPDQTTSVSKESEVDIVESAATQQDQTVGLRDSMTEKDVTNSELCSIPPGRVLETIEEEEPKKPAQDVTPQKKKSMEEKEMRKFVTPVPNNHSESVLTPQSHKSSPRTVTTQSTTQKKKIPTYDPPASRRNVEATDLQRKKAPLLHPKKTQLEMPQKRKLSRSKSPSPFSNKSRATSPTTSVKAQRKENSLNLLPRKKPRKSREATLDSDPPKQRSRTPSPLPVETQENLQVNSFHKAENDPQSREELPLVNEEISKMETTVEEKESVTASELDSGSTDLENITKELEFMIMDAKILQDKVLEIKVRLAIQANKLARLDNPIIHQRLLRLKEKAGHFLNAV